MNKRQKRLNPYKSPRMLKALTERAGEQLNWMEQRDRLEGLKVSNDLHAIPGLNAETLRVLFG